MISVTSRKKYSSQPRQLCSRKKIDDFVAGSSLQNKSLEIFLDQDILNILHSSFQEIGIGGIREMDVDLAATISID